MVGRQLAGGRFRGQHEPSKVAFSALHLVALRLGALRLGALHLGALRLGALHLSASAAVVLTRLLAMVSIQVAATAKPTKATGAAMAARGGRASVHVVCRQPAPAKLTKQQSTKSGNPPPPGRTCAQRRSLLIHWSDWSVTVKARCLACRPYLFFGGAVPP